MTNEELSNLELESIAGELVWKGKCSKKYPDLNEVELNIQLDEDWDIYCYTHR